MTDNVYYFQRRRIFNFYIIIIIIFIILTFSRDYKNKFNYNNNETLNLLRSSFDYELFVIYR